MDQLRHLVSKKKIRFIQDGFDLDLTYINNRIIAMGFPSEGREGLYRNNMKDVQKFFKAYHDGHYKVYNLCSERSYPANSFNQQACYPFDDHNACAFKLLVDICTDAATFLSADEKNVVAIHCKAGKGRTGLVICCLLRFLGDCGTADESLKFYGSKRTSNGKGVTIPSQTRYVRYFNTFVKHYHTPGKPFNFQGPKIKIASFVLAPKADFDVGGGCDPYFKIYTADGTEIYNMKADKTQKIRNWKKEPSFELKTNVTIQGDVKVQFYDKDSFGSDDKMFAFWINTSFVRQELVIFHKNDLDSAIKDKKCDNFPANFICQIRFEGVPEEGHAVDEEDPHHSTKSSNTSVIADDDDVDDDDEDEDGDVPPPPPSLNEEDLKQMEKLSV